MNTMTQKQQDFILSLIDSREVGAEFTSSLNSAWETLTVSQASSVIDSLKKMPYKSSVSISNAPLSLDSIPKSFYAIPAQAVNLVLKDETISNDYMFVVVAEYMGTRYMKKVTGNVGGFSRHRMTRKDVRAVADLLAVEPMFFIKKFAELHSVCGKCGAELTDEKSREYKFGPDCRKMLGIK